MGARIVDGIDFGELLTRSDQTFRCRRMRQWLRASIVLNVLLAGALALLVGSLNSREAGAFPSSAPAIFSGLSR